MNQEQELQEELQEPQQVYFKKTRMYLGVNWYENTKDSKSVSPEFKSLYHCLNTKTADQYIIYRTDNQYHRWANCTENQVKEMINENHHIYEVLPKNGQRKVYFDIDCLKTKTKLSFQEFIEKCTCIIQSLFKDAVFQISGSESEKYSLHIIVSNYYSNNQKEMKVLKTFCEFFSDFGFDPSVYSINRNMKCINQSKGYKSKIIDGKQTRIKDTRIQAYIAGSLDLSKHLININFDDDAKHIIDVDFTDYITILETGEETEIAK